MNGVYWIYTDASTSLAPPAPQPASGERRLTPIPLAVVLCPRGGYGLERELMHLKRGGVTTLVSLLSLAQVNMLELANEGMLAQRLGMSFIHHPLPDHELPPDLEKFRAFAAELAERVKAGERVGVHCWGSIGRATLAAVATLVHLGWPAGVALRAVEAARGCPVPDTEEQAEWILSYQAQA